MEKRDSSNSNTLKLETLIRDYANKTNSNAGIELSNMTNINGNTLLDVLNNLELDSEKITEEYKRAKYDYDEKSKDYAKLEEKYKKLEENYKGLLDTLKLILKDPIFSSIEGLIKIIRETEENIEKRRF